ncbi:hypothetical protein MNEG_12390, partial [Monoraphidium neglectum]
MEHLSEALVVHQHERALLCTGDDGIDAFIGSSSSSSERQACYAFAAWLLDNPGKAGAPGTWEEPSTDFK